MTSDFVLHFVVISEVCLYGKELCNDLCLDDKRWHDRICFSLCLAICLIRNWCEMLTRVYDEEESLISNNVKVVVSALKVDCVVTQIGTGHQAGLVVELCWYFSLLIDLRARHSLIVLWLRIVRGMFMFSFLTFCVYLDPHPCDVLGDLILR